MTRGAVLTPRVHSLKTEPANLAAWPRLFVTSSRRWKEASRQMALDIEHRGLRPQRAGAER